MTLFFNVINWLIKCMQFDLKIRARSFEKKIILISDVWQANSI